MNVSSIKASQRAALVPLLALFLLSLLVAALIYQLPFTSRIDVGSGRDAPYVRGFSFRENLPDGSDARWSNGQAEIHFIGVGTQPGTLTLRFAAPRPQNPASVEILANGDDISSAAPSAMEEQSWEIDAAVVGRGSDLAVTLNSDTFTQPPDTRPLGLLVESAQFQAHGSPALPSPRVLFYLPALVALGYVIGRVWSGSDRAAVVIGAATLFVAALALYNARVETAYFIAPFFWLLLTLFGGAIALVLALRGLTTGMGAPQLSARSLRLLFLAMVGAFGVRMIFATDPGYIVDVQDYVVWSYKTVTYGLGSAYVAMEGLWSADNPPVMLYVLHLMGELYRAVFAPDFLYPAVAGDPQLRAVSENAALLADPVHRTLLRLPFLLADVVTGALIFVAARKYISEGGAWVIAFAFWLNPAVLWNGAYWGQTDALHTLLILAAFLLLNIKRPGAAFFVYAIAALTKPQAVIFAPLLLLYAWRVGEWRGLLRAVGFGALGAAVMLLPMFLAGGVESTFGFFQNVAGFHPVISANAHNAWWLVSGGQVDVADSAAIFPGAPVSYRLTSLLLFGAVYVAVLWHARRAAPDEFFELGAFCAFAFFMLVTEIHENHGYALLPLLAVAMARDKLLIPFYAVLSVTMTLNYALHDPPLLSAVSGLDSAALRWFNALVNTIVLGAWLIYLFVPIPALFARPAVRRTA